MAISSFILPSPGVEVRHKDLLML
jgi:hypothetical protein